MRICIVCEGQTEVEFVRSCLTPHFTRFNRYVYPSLLRAPSGNHRGGRVTVERLANFISHEYHNCDRITTFVDLYGFQGAGGADKEALEAQILERVAAQSPRLEARFILPYVQRHEFEALLFSNVSEFQWALDGWSEDVHRTLADIRAGYGNPEDINNSRETAPSKRILGAFPRGTYSKTEHGPLIAEAIGVDVMRSACPGFSAWLTHLENW